MIYTVALLYLAVIVFLEISHRIEREKIQGTEKAEKKVTQHRHFSPHRKAIEKLRRDKE
ncbi:MAG: hypothetical protein IJN48_05560 [Clostridia bacterium]|nr:hypothetical protein [Clostridia bacterium]